MRKRTILVACAMACAWGTAQQTARAQYNLFGNDWSTGTIYSIDATTGAASNPVPLSPVVQNLTGIAEGPDGFFYGISAGGAATLHKINPLTGASQFVGTTQKNFVTEGDIDFDPTTGVLYAIQETEVGNERALFTVDPATGFTVEVGVIQIGGDLSAMAFDAAGDLWVLDTSFQNDWLIQVNKADGSEISRIPLVNGASGNILGATAGMDFHPATGVAYVADGFTMGTDKLFTLDTGTGLLSEIGPLGLPNGVAGLEFSLIPEPASLSLLLVGGAAVLRRRRP